MKEYMRKIIATVAAFAVVVATAAAPAFATTQTTILNSGDNAVVTTTSSTTTNVNTSVSNDASITQVSSINQNGGGNVIDGNIAVGSLCNPCAPVSGGVGLQVGSNTATVNQSASDINNNVVGVSVDANSQANNGTNLVNTGNNVLVVTNDSVTTNVNTSAVNRARIGEFSSINQNGGNNVVTDNIGSPILAVTGGNSASVNQNVSGVNENVVGVAIHAPTSTGQVGCLVCAPCLGGTCSNITNTGDKLTFVGTSSTNTNVNTYTSNYLSLWQKSKINQNLGFNVLADNIGGGALGIGSNVAGVTQGLSNANNNMVGVSVGSSLPMGGTLSTIVNTGFAPLIVTSSTDNTNANTAALNTLWGFQAQWTNSNNGFNVLVDNIGGTLTLVGGNAGGTAQGMSGVNNNAALIGNNSLSLLALLVLLL